VIVTVSPTISGRRAHSELDARFSADARWAYETKQDGRTSQLIFDVPALISYISEVMTLLPGDVILTGTPAGVGLLESRDVVEVEVEEIGVLRNPVLRRS